MTQTYTAENTLEAILVLMREAGAFIKAQAASPRTHFITDLVLEEVLTNIVKYSYEDQARHEIEVAAAVSAGQVSLEFRDDGRAFDPIQAPPPKFGEPVKTQKLGGRGIHLVKVFVKDCAYRRENGWNIQTFQFPA
jgi:anti-sigma regulatory factor (Ser/Thr protein kinase)